MKRKKNHDRHPSPAEAGSFLRYSLEEATSDACIGISPDPAVDPVELVGKTHADRQQIIGVLRRIAAKARTKPIKPEAMAAHKQFFDEKHRQQPDLQARLIIWELYRSTARAGGFIPPCWWLQIDAALVGAHPQAPTEVDEADALHAHFQPAQPKPSLH